MNLHTRGDGGLGISTSNNLQEPWEFLECFLQQAIPISSLSVWLGELCQVPFEVAEEPEDEEEEANAEESPKGEEKRDDEVEEEVDDEEDDEDGEADPIEEPRVIGCDDVDADMAVKSLATLGDDGVFDPKYFYPYALAIQPQLWLAGLIVGPVYCNNNPDQSKCRVM